jgi:Icc-related predicted phosphoesterase
VSADSNRVDKLLSSYEPARHARKDAASPTLCGLAEPGKRVMHDFSLIQDFEPWVYEQNAAFQQVVASRLKASDVVGSHHLPAPASIPERFARSAMNAFFVCDMTSYISERQPKLWIHGHSHDRCDYLLGATRVVANPLGYLSEPRSLEALTPRFR